MEIITIAAGPHPCSNMFGCRNPSRRRSGSRPYLMPFWVPFGLWIWAILLRTSSGVFLSSSYTSGASSRTAGSSLSLTSVCYATFNFYLRYFVQWFAQNASLSVQLTCVRNGSGDVRLLYVEVQNIVSIVYTSTFTVECIQITAFTLCLPAEGILRIVIYTKRGNYFIKLVMSRLQAV